MEEAYQKEIDLVHALRAIRAELQIPLGQAIDVYVSKLPSHPSILQSLVKIRSLHEGHCEGATAIVHDITVSVPLPEELKEKERLRLHKEFEKLGKQITTLETQLCNEDFIARAPAHLVQKTKDSLLQARGALSELAGKLQSL